MSQMGNPLRILVENPLSSKFIFSVTPGVVELLPSPVPAHQLPSTFKLTMGGERKAQTLVV